MCSEDGPEGLYQKGAGGERKGVFIWLRIHNLCSLTSNHWCTKRGRVLILSWVMNYFNLITQWSLVLHCKSKAGWAGRCQVPDHQFGKGRKDGVVVSGRKKKVWNSVCTSAKTQDSLKRMSPVVWLYLCFPKVDAAGWNNVNACKIRIFLNLYNFFFLKKLRTSYFKAFSVHLSANYILKSCQTKQQSPAK